MIIVFDLDNVLYDEISFVRSGLKVVSEYIFQKFSVPTNKSMEFLNKRLSKGRKGILDDLLSEFGLHSRKRVHECLIVYRKHNPKIKLYTEADNCLKKIKDLPLYLVTDGNKIVQKNKINALGLYDRLKFCFLTSHYGLKNSKPSPYCFKRICQLENVKPAQVIYVGDDPNKDFVGIKPLGFKTIRILQGPHKNIKKGKKFEADYIIKSLSELNIEFIKKIS